MSAVDAQNHVITLLEKMDHVVYGFAAVREFLSPDFRHLPYAVSIGIPLDNAIVDTIIAGPTPIYYDEYLKVNDKLDLITRHIHHEIEGLGYLAYAVPSSKRTDFVNIKGEFPHKAAAVKSGLGWIGKSSLLITKQFGPRIRLSTVLTDLPLQPSGVVGKNYCGQCRKCTDACPSGAIAGNLWTHDTSREDLVDVRKCDIWKIDHYPQFHGHVCGICVAVCPHGNKRPR